MKASLLLVISFNLIAMDPKTDELKFGDTPKPEWVDINGLDKEEVLKTLYNYATPFDEKDILEEKYILMAKNKEWEIGRLKNKSLHVNLSKNRFNAGCYNQVNGENAAQEAIEQLKKAKNHDSADKK